MDIADFIDQCRAKQTRYCKTADPSARGLLGQTVWKKEMTTTKQTPKNPILPLALDETDLHAVPLWPAETFQYLFRALFYFTSFGIVFKCMPVSCGAINTDATQAFGTPCLGAREKEAE